MLKKCRLLFLLLAGLLLLSSCNARDFSNVEHGTQATDTQDATLPSSPDRGEIGDTHFGPELIFETQNQNEYEMFLQSQECSVHLFSLDIFDCFGDFSNFEAFNVSSNLDFDVTYQFRFEQINTKIFAVSRGNYWSDTDYLLWFGDVYIEDEDMPENLCENPKTHWLRSSENELVEAAYYHKYNIESDDKYIHFRINDNIFLRYYGNYMRMCFIFDDYAMELYFSPVENMLEGSELTCTNPTIKALLTKSTSKEAAEDLYNLWKNALK
ncbi:MAG: hypothetical protein IJX28_03055 [Clostridia bacterium]|nr:hypothetical protein [Clostridia bacterium]